MTNNNITFSNGTNRIWNGYTNVLGEQSIGAFTTNVCKKHTDFYMFHVEQWEIDTFLKDTKLKPNEIILRYETKTTRVSKMLPLIKFNIAKGLVYYLKDSDVDDINFETRGIKVKWCDLNETLNKDF